LSFCVWNASRAEGLPVDHPNEKRRLRSNKYTVPERILMKIDGSCHCGRISYEAELDPERVGICHCTDCQTLSGTAFRTIALVSADTFEISGEPKIYVKTGESGNKRAQAFCPECGSPIYASAAGDNPRVYNLRLGTVRQRDRLPPKFQVWCRSAQSWLSGLESVPGKEKQ
jgi:hypothetical protein